MARAKMPRSSVRPKSSPLYTPERAKERINEILQSKLFQPLVRSTRKGPGSILVEERTSNSYSDRKWHDAESKMRMALFSAATVMGLREEITEKQYQRRRNREGTQFTTYDQREEHVHFSRRGNRIISNERDQPQMSRRYRVVDKKGKPVFEFIDVYNVEKEWGMKPLVSSHMRFFAHPAAVILAELARRPPKYPDEAKRFVLRKMGANIARDVVEKTSDIRFDEMAWIKKKGKPGKMIEAAEDRHEFGVSIKNISRAHSVIHTHPANEPFPSPIDVNRFIHSVQNGTKFEHVFVVNTQNGKEMGRVVFHATARFRKSLRKKTPIIREILARLNHTGRRLDVSDFFDYEALQREGLRIRVRPAYGYNFKVGYFVKDTARRLNLKR
jgi:proteasome lid subunit RPN8/RPN11